MITFDEQQRVFHLKNKEISYLFSVEEGNILSHLYFGPAIRNYHGERRYPRVDRGFSGNFLGRWTELTLKMICCRSIQETIPETIACLRLLSKQKMVHD